jgi:GDP-4-dehydro-6-deoxy-D-mannose reductase
MSSRRAFVTGVSGFAGRELAAQLVAAGWHVEGTVNTRTSGIEGVTEHRVRIDDRDALARLLATSTPDVVFHLAAIVDTVTTPDVDELHRVNTLGTVAVTEAMRAVALDARLLFTSSSFAYGRTAADDQPVRESHALAPITPYGVSKAEGEKIVARLRDEAGTDTVVTRAFQHSGPGHTGEYALADWARQLVAIERTGGAGAIVTGNLDLARDYLDVRDVASAYVAVAERGRSGETYNVCSGEPVTMRELLVGLIEAFGLEVRIETDPARLRAIDQPLFVGDPSKLRADTGWARRFSHPEMLAALAASARASS